MATTPRQQIASPQSFTSDPLEQQFAKQFSDQNSAVGAFALANMMTAGAQRERGQDVYLENLKQSNALAAALAQQDMQSDLLKESLQQGHHYITAGVDPSDMPLVQRLFTGNSGNLAADLKRALIQSQIEENKAKAAHAGDAGADTVTYTTQMGAYGPEGSQVVVKSKDPNRGGTTMGNIVAGQTVQRGLPPPPPGQPYARTGAKPGQSAISFQRDKYPQ